MLILKTKITYDDVGDTAIVETASPWVKLEIEKLMAFDEKIKLVARGEITSIYEVPKKHVELRCRKKHAKKMRG